MAAFHTRCEPLEELEHAQNLHSNGVLCAPVRGRKLIRILHRPVRAGSPASSGTSVFPVSSYLCLKATCIEKHWTSSKVRKGYVTLMFENHNPKVARKKAQSKLHYIKFDKQLASLQKLQGHHLRQTRS